MTKTALVPAVILSLFLPLSAIAADSYTLTTYYPAPNGKYNTLSANNFTSNTAATFNGAVTMNTGLTVNSLTVNNAATLQGTLGVTGATTLGILTATGLTRLNGGLDVGWGRLKVDPLGPVSTTSTLDVGLKATFNAGATITGNTTVTSGELYVEGTPGSWAGIILRDSDPSLSFHYLIKATPPTDSDELTITKSGGTAKFSIDATKVGLTGTTINLTGPTINLIGPLKVTDDSIFGDDAINTGNVMVGNDLTVGNTLTLDGIILRKSLDATSTTTVLNVTNTAFEAESVFSRSDERLKENIAPLTNALTKVKALNGVSFKLKGKPEQQIGLIAQNVEKTVPEVVRTGQDGMKSVEYGHLVGLLIEAIKEQQSEIEGLKKNLQDLNARIPAVPGPQP